jgi:hypothetical protein
MTLSLVHRTKTSISNVPLTTLLLLDSTLSHGSNNVFTTTIIRSFHQGRQPNGYQRRRREQMCLPCGSSMPLSRLFHSSLNCSFNHSCSQIPFFLPHPSSFPVLQKKLLISHLACFSRLPFSSFQGKFMFFDN